jgi:branched-subunit amino acid transport protein
MSTGLPHSAWLFILAGAAVTYAWRAGGVLFSGRINPDSAAMRWMAAVAYALLAGLIARLIVLPQGALGGTALAWRIAAVAVTLAIYFLTRRNIALGVLAGTATMILLVMGFGA